MDYVKLGSSDLQVSRVCLGCMGFGDPAAGMHSWTLGEDDSRAIMRRALDSGINFFDTAVAYQGGTSEQFVGRALRDFARRGDYVLATKNAPMPQEDREAGLSGQAYIAKMVDTSLRNLGLDTIDLYILHRWDSHTPLYELMEGLNNAVKAGKVRAIGISNCFAYQLAKANALAEKEGFARFVSVQGHYNLLFREEEREMLRLCREDNIAVTPYSALAAGRLSRLPGEQSLRLQQDAFAKTKYDATEVQDQQIILRVAELAKRRGVSMTEISLAWLMGKGAIPVAGATKPHHIDGAVKAASLTLTAEENAWLEEPYVPHRLVGMMTTL